ncbi:unnamed protein product [Fraxinus pennsylvanica]|uniref:Uncharacterized protein n=1 Tax=Fraxinus pennsylvanica TaxID=56036 RepID=A0AAD1ZGP0_9LAMI|nr:unnamed protein product [Fraxinus pennsylvanica]
MGKRALLFVVWFAVVVSVGWCWGEDAAKTANLAAGNVKVRVEESKQSASETAHDFEDKVESWADWAMNKFTGESGSSHDGEKDVAPTIKENVKYAASKSSDTLNSAAYETSKYASEKGNDVGETTSKKIGDAKDYASDKYGQVINTASDIANDAKEFGKDKANKAYEMA